MLSALRVSSLSCSHNLRLYCSHNALGLSGVVSGTEPLRPPWEHYNIGHRGGGKPRAALKKRDALCQSAAVTSNCRLLIRTRRNLRLPNVLAPLTIRPAGVPYGRSDQLRAKSGEMGRGERDGARAPSSSRINGDRRSVGHVWRRTSAASIQFVATLPCPPPGGGVIRLSRCTAPDGRRPADSRKNGANSPVRGRFPGMRLARSFVNVLKTCKPLLTSRTNVAANYRCRWFPVTLAAL